ncbi:MAG: methyltransferase domain-containing protein [Ruminococcus sp.]|nr:methyltransferase domain-containing protein [Ruminococcus sp.]
MDIDENRIADLDIYLTRMQRSILDKMFFIDKVFEPFEYIVDFGCANGELIKAMSSMFPDYKYIGYDISPEMISAARANVRGAQFCDDWTEIKAPFDRSLINISSTIHEVYSYGTEGDISQFWERVFESGFRYVAIRDMMFSETQDGPADEEQLAVIRQSEYGQWLSDFEKVWGKVVTQRQLVHFLLKYKYTQNWDREVHENYFPISCEQFEKKLPGSYRIVFRESFTLPFTAWQIRRDFGISLKENTHLKIILERL